MLETIDSPYIVAATTDNFKPLVVDNSHHGPVLVNFWSKNAGPCLRQYPILDQLIHHYEGRLLLVNIDTEKEFVYTKEYGIASLPTLKLFRHGVVVETWHGYQSAEELSRVLDRYVSRPSDQALAEAIQIYAEGQHDQAYELIVNTIVDDPVNPRLPLAMCKLLTHEKRYVEAMKLIDALPEDIRQDKEITQLSAILYFQEDAELIHDVESLIAQLDSNPGEPAKQRLLVAYYVLQQEYESALQALAVIMETDPEFQQNYAQTAMLKIFDILGLDHTLVSKYRKYLSHYRH